MTTPRATTRATPPTWATPADTEGYLAHQLMLVRTGRKTRAPSIRRCDDCGEPFIGDSSGLSYCPTCRPTHQRRCADCTQLFPNTPTGDRRCGCCRHQLALVHTGGPS
jgi:hypothetical protein